MLGLTQKYAIERNQNRACDLNEIFYLKIIKASDNATLVAKDSKKCCKQFFVNKVR